MGFISLPSSYSPSSTLLGCSLCLFFLFNSGAFPTGDSEWRLAVAEIILFGLFSCFRDKGAREHATI